MYGRAGRWQELLRARAAWVSTAAEARSASRAGGRFPTPADQTLGSEGCQGALKNEAPQLHLRRVVPGHFSEKKRHGNGGEGEVLTEKKHSKSWRVPSTY